MVRSRHGVLSGLGVLWHTKQAAPAEARMRGLCVAAAASLMWLGEQRAEPSPAMLLTLPQRDRARSTTSPAPASISADGRYVAFSSYERLTAADEDTVADIYVLDRATGVVTLESVGGDGLVDTADCLYPRVSGDGRFLVFQALVETVGVARAYSDVIWRDRMRNVSRLISRSETGQRADGWSGSAAVSDDGTMVVFESAATNLVPGIDANHQHPDAYLVHTTTGSIRRLSLDDQGVQPSEGSSGYPTISGDGRYVAFISSAPLTTTPLTTTVPRRGSASEQTRLFHVYVHDARLARTTRVNAQSGGIPNQSSLRAAISRDGAYVAFASAATNFVPRDRNRSTDVFLYEMKTGAVTLVSRAASRRSANGASGYPSISGDGRFVAFQSEASDLICSGKCRASAEDINLLSDVFVFDRVTGLIRWVSAGNRGGWIEESGGPALDDTGRIVAFTSRHPIDEHDTHHDFDLFVQVPTDSAGLR